MTLSLRARAIITAIAVFVLAAVYFPLLVVLVNSFNASRVFSWPPPSYTTDWWGKALHNDGVRQALFTSIQAATAATLLALVLGSLAAVAVSRYTFFGRQTINLLLVLPIALPGIVTGMALNSSFSLVLRPLGIQFGLFTVILGHTTFCIVVVFNNVLARMRRLPMSLAEASADLGADPLTTARLITFPLLRSALVAGAVLAFGLSFDDLHDLGLLCAKVIAARHNHADRLTLAIRHNYGVGNHPPLKIDIGLGENGDIGELIVFHPVSLRIPNPDLQV